MRKTGIASSIAVFIVIGIVACSGVKLRHIEANPDARNFHPKSIAVLPVDAGTYAEAKGIADAVILEALADTKWYGNIVAGDKMQKLLLSDAEFQKAVLDYTMKLKTLGFSDPELSKKIGDTAKVDALLIANVEYWFYTKEDDNNIAKVGMGITMIDANTGKQIWTAAHHIDEIYRFSFSKPTLSEAAKKLAGLIVNAMPH
ncbi:MAG: hypothetical protein PHN75_16310 [Syntrophales bacterium]|nr:hypothetical protein [Syntrophales bacterium]